MRKPLMSGTAILAAMVLALGLGAAGTARSQEDSKGRPWLGINMQTIDDDLKDAYGGRNGVLVSRVASGSPAKSAGILRGDLIIRIDGKDIDDSDALSDAIASHEVGEKVSVTLVRDDRERTIVATLAERPDDDDEGMPVPYAPRAPRPPRAPRAPYQSWGWNGNEFPRMMMFDSRPRLGVRIESLNDQLGDYFDTPSGKGVLVVEVIDDTPAKDAGMRAGDVITKVDGKVIEDTDDLHRALRAASGETQIEVLRKGTRQVLTPTLRAPRTRSMTWSSDDDSDEVKSKTKSKSSMSSSEEAQLRKEIDELRRELEELKQDRGDK